MNYLIFKGRDSRDVKGLVICELPPITKPQMRVAETIINGVDGSHIEELGYATYDKALAIGITPQADINEVINFFSGTGEVTFSNEPDKYYKATIINQIDYTRLVRFRTATVTFRVQPFKYANEEDIIVGSGNVGNLFDVSKWSASSGSLSVTSGSVVVEDGSIQLKSPNEKEQSLLGTYSDAKSPTSNDKSIVKKFGVVVDAFTDYTLSFNVSNSGNVSVYFYDTECAYLSSIKFEFNKLGLQTNTFATPKGCGYVCLKIVNRGYVESISSDTSLRISNIQIKKKVEIGIVEVNNNGNVVSKPVIELMGGGTVTFLLNGNVLFDYTFTSNGEMVVIDSEKQDAYWGAVLKNRNMIGVFPEFNIGKNTVSCVGDVQSIKISSYSRWM